MKAVDITDIFYCFASLDFPVKGIMWGYV